MERKPHGKNRLPKGWRFSCETIEELGGSHKINGNS